MEKSLNKTAMSVLAVMLAVITCLMFLIFASRRFMAVDNRNEVTTVKVVADFYEDGQKIYVGDNDNISVYHESKVNKYKTSISVSGNPMETIIENGSLVFYIPLYDNDTQEQEEDYIRKAITIDDTIHTVMASDFSFIDSENIPTEIYKNGEEMVGQFDSYYISAPKQYHGLIINWHVEKELSQTVEKEDYAINMSVTTGSIYEGQEGIPEYITTEGSAELGYTGQFCEYKGYSARKSYSSDGEIPYLEIDLDGSEITAMADGTVTEVNTFEDYMIVQYDDALFFKYENVATDKMSKDSVDKDDLIGVATGDSFSLYCISNGEFIGAEWLFDDFERPIEGPSLPQMFQMDEEWKDIVYGTNTIGGGGCGPTNFAMIASGLTKQTVTPDEIVSVLKSMRSGNWYYVQGEGSSYAIFPKLCDYYDLNLNEGMSVSEKAIREELDKGRIVLISISAGSIYKGAGHFVTIRGIDDNGDFLINDSASYFKLNQSYEYSDLYPIKSARSIWR